MHSSWILICRLIILSKFGYVFSGCTRKNRRNKVLNMGLKTVKSVGEEKGVHLFER